MRSRQARIFSVKLLTQQKNSLCGILTLWQIWYPLVSSPPFWMDGHEGKRWPADRRPKKGTGGQRVIALSCYTQKHMYEWQDYDPPSKG